jgi:hypothetical protein
MPADAVDRTDIIARVCNALTRGDADAARALARTEYPFVHQVNTGRSYTELQSMRVFLRDHFTDRYAGARLVFPGTLRLLSKVLPDEFPAHSNWKMSESHIIYYELFPVIDHVVPIARGGADDASNWVATSMLRNSAKAHWTLEELGWKLLPVPTSSTWDGLVGWAQRFLRTYPEHLSDKYITRWSRAAEKALEERQAEPRTTT